MGYVNLPPAQVPELLERRDLEILDMRDQRSFDAGHIQRAKPADDNNVGRLMRNRQRDMPILVYCYRGNSSRELAGFFSGLGYRDVFNLDGGWRAWEMYCRQTQE